MPVSWLAIGEVQHFEGCSIDTDMMFFGKQSGESDFEHEAEELKHDEARKDHATRKNGGSNTHAIPLSF